jgi:hypothetical protein
VPPVSGPQFLAFRLLRGGFLAPVSGGDFPISVLGGAETDSTTPPAAVCERRAFRDEPLGTSRIGKAFGPIMGLWFLSIALLGLWGATRHPAVFAALNPLYELRYLLLNGYASFLFRIGNGRE